MFDFLSMIGTYEARKVARLEQDDLVVSTARVTDSNRPYETGISHPNYSDGKWVIVESYDSLEDAKAGHDKWVGRMTTEPLPAQLVDCANSGIGQFVRSLGCSTSFEKGEPT